jgi:hypothetical protein
MNKWLFTLIVIAGVVCAQTPPVGQGTVVGAPIVPAGQYGTHAADYGIGGWHSVSNLADVATNLYQEGMAVYELSSGTLYVRTNSTWVTFASGSGGDYLPTTGGVVRGNVSIYQTNLTGGRGLCAYMWGGNALLEGAAVGPAFTGRRALGSEAAPEAVTNGTILAVLAGRGYDGAEWGELSDAQIALVASETYTAGAHGSRIEFKTTLAGTTSRVIRAYIDDIGLSAYRFLRTQTGAYLGNETMTYDDIQDEIAALRDSTLWGSTNAHPVFGDAAILSVTNPVATQLLSTNVVEGTNDLGRTINIEPIRSGLLAGTYTRRTYMRKSGPPAATAYFTLESISPTATNVIQVSNISAPLEKNTIKLFEAYARLQTNYVATATNEYLAIHRYIVSAGNQTITFYSGDGYPSVLQSPTLDFEAAGVQSFNGRAGSVTLQRSDITDLGYLLMGDGGDPGEGLIRAYTADGENALVVMASNSAIVGTALYDYGVGGTAKNYGTVGYAYYNIGIYGYAQQEWGGYFSGATGGVYAVARDAGPAIFAGKGGLVVSNGEPLNLGGVDAYAWPVADSAWTNKSSITNVSYGLTNLGTQYFPLLSLTPDVTNQIRAGVDAYTWGPHAGLYVTNDTLIIVNNVTQNVQNANFTVESVDAETSNRVANALQYITTNSGTALFGYALRPSHIYPWGSDARPWGPLYINQAGATNALFLGVNSFVRLTSAGAMHSIFDEGYPPTAAQVGAISNVVMTTNALGYCLITNSTAYLGTGTVAGVSGAITNNQLSLTLGLETNKAVTAVMSNANVLGLASLTNANVSGTLISSNLLRSVGTFVGLGASVFSNKLSVLGTNDGVQLSVRGSTGGTQLSNIFAVLSKDGATVAGIDNAGNLSLSGSLTNLGIKATGNVAVDGTLTVSNTLTAVGNLVNRGVTNLDSFYWPTYYQTNSTGTNTIAFTNGCSIDLVCTGALPCYITASAMSANSYGQMNLYIDNNGTNVVTWDTNVFNARYWPTLTDTNGTDLVLVKTAGSTVLTVNGPVTLAQMGVITNLVRTNAPISASYISGLSLILGTNIAYGVSATVTNLGPEGVTNVSVYVDGYMTTNMVNP